MTTAYRVPRRFILPPDEPPPYGFFAVSLLGHALFLFLMAAVSAYLGARVDQSKVYIVNLLPSAPAAGSSAPRTVSRPPAEPAAKPAETTPPKPVTERQPPRPEKVEAPRVKETPPPKPEPSRPSSAPEPPPPPRPTEVARAATPRPDELALPRRVEKEAPALETPVAREKLIERTPLPPRPPVATAAVPPPARAPEPPRVAQPPASREAPPPPAPAVATARPGVEPMRLGRPDAPAPATGSISLDVSDFPFTYYLRQVQAKISERWAPPPAAAAGGERAVIMFEIGRDGQIKEPKLERESGNALYDQSALRAVVEASPFPPLPPEFKAPWLRVHFGFEFRPDQG